MTAARPARFRSENPGQLAEVFSELPDLFKAVQALAPPEALALQVREDTHAPPSVRATAALLNSRDFRRAFRCEGGDPMAPLPLCALW